MRRSCQDARGVRNVGKRQFNIEVAVQNAGVSRAGRMQVGAILIPIQRVGTELVAR